MHMCPSDVASTLQCCSVASALCRGAIMPQHCQYHTVLRSRGCGNHALQGTIQGCARRRRRATIQRIIAEALLSNIAFHRIAKKSPWMQLQMGQTASSPIGAVPLELGMSHSCLSLILPANA
jgi:hypothetical protein